MPLPVVPLVIAGGSAIAGAVTGFSLSSKLGDGIKFLSIVVGLFLIFILARRFNLFLT